MKKTKQIIPLPFPFYFWTLAALAMAGVLDSIYLSISHYRVYTDIAYESFCAISSAIALLTRRNEAMASFVHFINMPLLFTSSVLVPVRQMPAWLEQIASFNPLTHVADSLRAALLPGWQETPLWHDGLLLGLTIVSFLFVYLALQHSPME